MELFDRWNHWYDGLPELWRFPTIVGILVLVGAINMTLTVGTGFPFGLLVLLAIFILAAVRLPYLFHADRSAAAQAPAALQSAPPHGGWAQHWNAWYEGVPELWRFQLILGLLVLVGALNMALTIAGGFPFALLVLLAIVGIAAIRMPRTMGWGWAASAPQPTALEPPPRALETSAPLPPLASVPTHAPVESVTSRAAEESTMPHAPERSMPLHTDEGATSHPPRESAPPPIPPQDAALPPGVESPTPPPAG